MRREINNDRLTGAHVSTALSVHDAVPFTLSDGMLWTKHPRICLCLCLSLDPNAGSSRATSKHTYHDEHDCGGPGASGRSMRGHSRARRGTNNAKNDNTKPSLA